MPKQRLFEHARRRLSSSVRLLHALVLMLATALPLLVPATASAAPQVTQRSITIGTSQISTSTTHAVSFRPATSGANSEILGIVVDYCTSPLVGTACTQPTGMVTPADASTVNVSHNGQNNVGFTVHANSDQTGRVILTHGTGLTSVATNQAVTFNLTVTNPSTTGSFYARILTYHTVPLAAAYAPNAPGTRLDEGGVAMSTANQLTITARVQEVLQFCAGTIDANTNGNTTDSCTDISGTSVDVGVVDSSSTAATANDAGKLMLRTNAVNGATITYFTEQETSSGALKVVGAACSGVSVTDQCFNSNATKTAITTGVEAFGMTGGAAIDGSNGTTTNLTYAADYNTGAGYAWNTTTTPAQIASSTTVVDDELIPLRFAATASATTPTGAYTTTATFIATGTF